MNANHLQALLREFHVVVFDYLYNSNTLIYYAFQLNLQCMFYNSMFRPVLYRRISVASNAIQTIDNEMIHLIIHCLNCI